MKKLLIFLLFITSCACVLFSCAEQDPCKLGHTLTSFSKNGDASCDRDGTMSATCTVCRTIVTVTDEGTKLSHTLGDFVSSGERHYRECRKCGCKTDGEAHAFVGGECLVCKADLLVTSEKELTLTFTDMGDYLAVCGGEGDGEILTIPEYHDGKRVCAITEGAFSRLKSLREVTIPASITSIGKDAFLDCTSLQRVNISSLEDWCKLSFTNKDSNPLYYSHALYLNGEEITELNIPSSVTSIGNYAFIGGFRFKKINLPDGVKTIGANAFTSCRSITTLVIPNSVTHIHTSAFFDCNDLLSVTLGSGVEYISETAFIDCYKMVELINHSALDIEAGSADYGKVGLYALDVHTGPSRLIYEGDFIFYVHGGRNYLVAYTGGDGSPSLPLEFMGGGYDIYKYAFYRHFYLYSITVPEGVGAIGQKTFSQCTALREITLPSTLSQIGKEAFYNCKKLSALHIKSIDSYLTLDFETADSNPLYHAGELYFGRVPLTRLIVPSDITEIKRHALVGAKQLLSLNLHTGLTKIAENALSGCTSLHALYYDGTRVEWGLVDGGGTALYELSVVCLASGESTPKKATVPGAMLSDDFEKYIIGPAFSGLCELLEKHLGAFDAKASVSVSGYGKLKSFNAYITDKSALIKYGTFNSSKIKSVTDAYLDYAKRVRGTTQDAGYKEIQSYISSMNLVLSEYSCYSIEALKEAYPFEDDYCTEAERAEYKASYDAVLEKWYETIPSMQSNGKPAYAIDKSLPEETIALKYNMLYTAIKHCIPSMSEDIAKECESRAGYTPHFSR